MNTAEKNAINMPSTPPFLTFDYTNTPNIPIMPIENPTTPAIKPLDDLYMNIPDFSLPDAFEERLERSDTVTDGTEKPSNSPKQAKSIEDGDKAEVLPSRDPQGLCQAKPASQKFSIRNHLRNSRVPKVN